MYVPEDVQFWLDNFCNNVKEIFTACEENNDCNSSQSDTETETLEDVAKKILSYFLFKDSESLYLSPARPPSHVFSH